jgi:hypothetical protein
VIGTGNPMPDVGRYIGMAQMMGGDLVWNVLEGVIHAIEGKESHQPDR